LSINKRVLRLIIDFLSIIRNQQLEKDACRDYRVPGDRSVFVLTRSRKRLYRVLPMILKAAIPVRAARKTGFDLPAAIAISCTLAYAFRRVNVFPVPASLSTFRRSYGGNLPPRLISLV
jgi:hypothetical protein